jgi:hypothetical protein
MPTFSEIPVFSFPAHKWVQRIRVVFTVSEIDLTDGATAKKFTPILLSRLPDELFDLVDPKLGIVQLLEIIASYDAPRKQVPGILNAPDISVRPSHQMTKLQDQLQGVININAEGLKLLAWQAVAVHLTDSLRQFSAMQGIGDQKAPTDEQLAQLDVLWQNSTNSVNQVSENSVTKIESHAKPSGELHKSSESDDLRNRIAILERNLVTPNNQPRQTPTFQESSTPQQQSVKPLFPSSGQRNNNYPNKQFNTYPNNQNYSNRFAKTNHQNHFSTNRGGNNGNFTQRQPQTNSTNPICYYHQNFGPKARYCNLPCMFHQSHNSNNNGNQGNEERAPSRS